MKKRTLVLGVGNILLTDEGFGVRTVEYLQNHYSFPPEVEVLDGGTLGLDLLPTLRGAKRLILIDAVSGGNLPGTVYTLDQQDLSLYFRDKVSVHQMGIQEVLAFLEVLNEPIEEIFVFGVEPASLELGLTLTPVVADKIPAVAQTLLHQLEKWQVEVQNHG